MTLVEMIVAVGVTGIVIMGVTSVITDYQMQIWGRESVADALKSKDVVVDLLRAKVSGVISANSKTDPMANSAVWSCPSGGTCLFKGGQITNSSGAIDGVELAVNCTSTTAIPVLSSAPFDTVANVGTNCSSCPTGTRPMMTVKQYDNGTLLRTLKFPDPNASNKTKGLVGMGLCFSAPSYIDEDGTTKWDMWRITIVPVYFTATPKPTDSSTRIAAIFKANPEELMISGMAQLGSKMTVLPGGGTTSGTTGTTGTTSGSTSTTGVGGP